MAVVRVSNIDLWWPNEYGNQVLYWLKLELENFSISKKIGFRTIELVEDPLIKGRTFYFRVNGVDVFAKGSNWIPAHVLPGFLNEKQLNIFF